MSPLETATVAVAYEYRGRLPPVTRLPGAGGLGYRRKLRAWQQEALDRLPRQRRRATSSPSPRPAPARPPTPCGSPPSCSTAASSARSPSWPPPSTSRPSGPTRRPGSASASTRRSATPAAAQSQDYHGVARHLRPGRLASRRCTASCTTTRRPSSSSTRSTTAATRRAGATASARRSSPATRRLSLTGTPFRSDTIPDPVRRATSWTRRASCAQPTDYTYGYAEALRDGVVRPVLFLAYGGACAGAPRPATSSRPGSASR